MKLFVVLLALKLTAAEKLNRRYLPPAGAKFSGGRSDDLQTPLEYPKSGYGGIAYAVDDSDNVKIGSPDEIEFYSLATKRPYYESLSHLRSGLNKPTVNFDLIVDNPGNVPIIAVSEGIGQNYQPHLFGMYGGNPMSIKYFNNTIEVAASDDLLASDEKIINPQVEEDLPTTSRPNNGTVTNLALNGQNLTLKKFERSQANTDRSAIVFNYENVQNLGRYFYNFDTSNGIHRDESASTAKGVKAKGSYSYNGDDGKVYTVTYTADENGFQPSGDHLPVIPTAIQNVIEQAKRDKDAGIIDDGSYDETKYGHMKYQGPVHRYMQKNSKTHKRKQVTGERKIEGPSKIKIYENINIVKDSKENLQPKQNKNRKQFGMRRVQVFYNRRNEKDAINIQSPKTKENQDYTSDYSQKFNHNKIVSNGTIILNHGVLNSNQEKTFEIPAMHEGYVYGPPKNIFVNGKYQDSVSTDTNLNNKSVLETQFDTDNQRNQNNNISEKGLLKVAQFVTSTEKPLYQQPYDGDFYAITNADVDQSIDNRRKSPTKKSDKKTTEQLYGNTLITKLIYHRKEIVPEEKTLNPEITVETDILSSHNDFNTENYQSTTPKSSEARHSIQTYENINQYEPTLSESALTSSNFDVDSFENEGYSENEGFFKTTPEKPTTFEDFSMSTYNPFVYTKEEPVGTDFTANVKVDEFKTTSRDSFGYITDSSNDSFTNGMQSDTESKATPYNDNEETLSTVNPKTLDDKSTRQFPNELGSDANKTLEDLHLGRDAIIGEDFSGPKQPERYDPKQGYYY